MEQIAVRGLHLNIQNLLGIRLTLDGRRPMSETKMEPRERTKIWVLALASVASLMAAQTRWRDLLDQRTHWPLRYRAQRVPESLDERRVSTFGALYW